MTTCIDTDNLLKGENYNELNEVFIIFICTFDPFDRGRPHYTLKTRCLQERDLDIADGVTKEIFNATAYAKEQDVEISAFLKYIDSKEATDDINFYNVGHGCPIIAKREFSKENSRRLKKYRM